MSSKRREVAGKRRPETLPETLSVAARRSGHADRVYASAASLLVMGMAYGLVAAAAILFATREAAIIDAMATLLGDTQGVIGAVALVIVALVVVAAVHVLAAYGIVNRRPWARWLGVALSVADLSAATLLLLAQFALERPLGTALIAAIVMLLNGFAAWALLTASDEFSSSPSEPTPEQ